MNIKLKSMPLLPEQSMETILTAIPVFPMLSLDRPVGLGSPMRSRACTERLKDWHRYIFIRSVLHLRCRLLTPSFQEMEITDMA